MNTNSTREIIRMLDKRLNGVKGQVSNKTEANTEQIIIGQSEIKLLSQIWSQQNKWDLVSKTAINCNASTALNLEFTFVLDNEPLPQVYKQHISQGYHSTSINCLIKNVKKGKHTLDIMAKADTGSCAVDIANINQLINYR